MAQTTHTALVTGAGRNIGRAIAMELARRGCNVVVNARANREEAEAVAAEVRALGPSQGSCENGMLNPNGRWLEVAAAAAPSPLASELRARSCATASVTKPGWLSTQKPRAQHGTHGTHGTHGMHSMNGRSPQTGAGGRAAACTWANGCCARHPGVCRDHISSPSRSQNAPTPSSSSGR